jgi:diguanylate cyclase (GGDEF)-like protein
VWSTTLVHLNMLFPLGLVSLALYDAWRKGSRMVIYPLLGWTPAMGVGLLRIVTYVLPGSSTPDVSVLYSFALAIEVIVTAVGIVGRFILLRQERDSAMTRAEEMEGIVGRDPLTGLNNRLSIERRFDELLSGGFRTMAVIDLDHFKDVNDTHGHATGDAVLKATARAIAGDRDTHAIRMGRGVHAAAAGPFAAERAERARRAITARVAAEVAGLDRIVTASMGLIERWRQPRPGGVRQPLCPLRPPAL